MQPKIVTLSKKQVIGLGLQQLIRRETKIEAGYLNLIQVFIFYNFHPLAERRLPPVIAEC